VRKRALEEKAQPSRGREKSNPASEGAILVPALCAGVKKRKRKNVKTTKEKKRVVSERKRDITEELLGGA